VSSRAALLMSLVLVGAAALSGCAVGPSDRPAVAVRDAPLPPGPPPTTAATATPVPLPPLNPPGSSDIPFSDCTAQTLRRLGTAATRSGLTYECGTTTVPLSPDEPRARRLGVIELAVLRVGTGVPLLVVGDVAGEPGRLLAARLANQLPAEMLNTFALIGVDRRGTGGSDPVRCIPDEVREQLVGIDPGAERAAQATLDAANEANQQCVQDIDERLTLIDSSRTASDLEQLRNKLRVDRLHAVGFGDGSRVLAAYLELFTSTAGRIVLDGAPDPALDAIGVGQEQAAAAELAFDAFAANCASRPDCPLGPEPRNTVQALANRLRDQPVIGRDGVTRVDAGTMYSALLIGLADQQRWPELAQALRAAGEGDVDGLAELVSPLLHYQDELPARLDAALLTTCNDTTTRVPPNRAQQLAEDWRTRSSMFGPLFALRLLACSPAPVPTRTVPTPRAANTPPVLLLGAEGDPVTPLTGTKRMADSLADGLLVTWQGHGHAAFPRTPCITSTVQRFLVDGQLPRNGMICPP
jgi:pimeloyl-ACP methyl ester carboxylesterase